MQGWIKLHRKIQEHWLYQEKRKFSRFEAWIDLLMMVNHEDAKVVLGNELIEVKRGQRITSIRQLCDRWGWSNTKVTQFLKLLESDGMATVKSDSKKTVITIDNYDFYQGREDKKTTDKQQENDEEATQKHTNKNDKNIEDEEETNPVALYERNFFPLTPMQIESIWDWVDDFKGNQEVICMAIKETALKNPSSPFKYLTRILVDWHKRKLFTLEDVLKAKEQYEKSKVIHLERKKQKQEQPQGRYIPKDAVVDINAGEDPNWTWKKPF